MSFFEGIQEALDEARYAHAVLEGKLAPLTAFNFPSDDSLDRYEKKLATKESSGMTLERVCREPLGLYLVRNMTICPYR